MEMLHHKLKVKDSFLYSIRMNAELLSANSEKTSGRLITTRPKGMTEKTDGMVGLKKK